MNSKFGNWESSMQFCKEFLLREIADVTIYDPPMSILREW